MKLVQKDPWRIQSQIQTNATNVVWVANSVQIQVPALFVKTDS